MHANPLHRARLGGGIALSEVTVRTCLSPRIVHLIDAGRFEQLPGGIYARSYVKAFAAVVGLDPDEAVRELSDHLPPDEDPLPAMRESAGSYLPPLVAGLGRWAAGARTSVAARLGHLWPSTLRVGGQSLGLAATAVDISFLLLVYAGLIRLTGWVTGTSLQSTIHLAGFEVAAVCSAIGLLYFVLFGGVGGRTPGGALCGLSASSGSAPLVLGTIWRRALWLSAGAEPASLRSRWDRDLDPAV